MPSHLPESHRDYNTKVYKRCIGKIKTTNCWSGISVVTLRNWLKNFETDEEQFLAHRILDHLIYRSEPQIFSILQTLLYQTIPSVLQRNGYSSKETRNLLSELKKVRGKLKIALNIDDDDITSSATELGRRIKTKFWVHESNIIKLSKIHELPKHSTVIILDDFCGTGGQVKGAIQRNIKPNNIDIFLCPLVMHRDSENIIKTHLVASGLITDFDSVEVIDGRYNIFSEKSNCFSWRNHSFHLEYKEIYKSLISRKMPSIKEKDQFGHGEQGLIFSFHFRCPNNCIPLIWRASETWSPLIRR